MNYEVGLLAMAVVTNALTFSSSPIVYFKNTETDKKQSCVCVLHINSNNSETTMKESGLIFFPLYFIILRLTWQCRRKQRVMENRVLAQLPTACSLLDRSEKREVYQQVPSRSKLLQSFQECIEKAFEPIWRICFTGLSVMTAYDVKLKCHLLISAYIADILEGKDFLSVRQDVLFSISCPRCVTPRCDKGHHCQYRFQNVNDTLPILSAFEFQKMKVYAQNMANRVSIHIVKPVFWNFPFVASDFRNNIHSMFCYELMYTFFPKF